MKDVAKAMGYRWAALILSLFTIWEIIERLISVSLSRWTNDVELRNMTSLPATSERRQELNNYYLRVYATFGLMHGEILSKRIVW
jgi:hypothetical protein